MVLKNIYPQATEKLNKRKNIDFSILDLKNFLKKRDYKLQNEFVKEIENFVDRNSLAITKKNKEIIKHCCNRCLKAHIIRKANEMDIDGDLLEFIRRTNEDVGHEGYYLDSDKLVNISKLDY